MSDRPLLDRPIPALDKALAELRRIRQLPALERGPHALVQATDAVTAQMIAGRVARYQCRLASGVIVHAEIELPRPRLHARFGLGVGGEDEAREDVLKSKPLDTIAKLADSENER